MAKAKRVTAKQRSARRRNIKVAQAARKRGTAKPGTILVRKGSKVTGKGTFDKTIPSNKELKKIVKERWTPSSGHQTYDWGGRGSGTPLSKSQRKRAHAKHKKEVIAYQVAAERSNIKKGRASTYAYNRYRDVMKRKRTKAGVTGKELAKAAWGKAYTEKVYGTKADKRAYATKVIRGKRFGAAGQKLANRMTRKGRKKKVRIL